MGAQLKAPPPRGPQPPVLPQSARAPRECRVCCAGTATVDHLCDTTAAIIDKG